MKIIDGFAGLGGWTQGAKRAGCTPVYAFNHWDQACQYHFINNPEVEPVCQDAHIIPWDSVPDHDLGLFSPSCQGHSKARGTDKPHHDKQRNTAWAVVDYAQYHRKPIIVENVTEMMDWVLWPSWCDAMQRLGYALSPHVVNAADHGVPQERVRVFVVCTLSKTPLKLDLPRRPHVPVNDYIKWDDYAWSLIDKPGRAKATLERIANGRKRFGDRFIAPFYGSGSGTTGRSVDRPIGTLTTLDRWAAIDGNFMRVLQPEENRAIMSFDDNTVLPRTKRTANKMLGNAVCPTVAQDIINSFRTQH